MLGGQQVIFLEMVDKKIKEKSVDKEMKQILKAIKTVIRINQNFNNSA